MKVRMYGCRGSTPGQPRGSHRYGGHTTCLRVESECLPKGYALAIDAGSGFVDLSRDVLKEGIKRLGILFTHYHHDHTQGIFLAPHTFVADAIDVLGPREQGKGPVEVLSQLMCKPWFPVDFPFVEQRFKFKALEHIGTQVLVFHPEAGANLMAINVYQTTLKEGRQLDFRRGGKFAINECLVIFMYRTLHPEYTVSYRFEEKPTGKVFVFMTDHEVTASFPQDLRAHLRGAHLLIQDGQYDQETYETKTAGFGHGTPEYCAETGVTAGIARLGITHHDPSATDADIDQRLEEARRHARKLTNDESAGEKIFACADFDIYDV